MPNQFVITEKFYSIIKNRFAKKKPLTGAIYLVAGGDLNFRPSGYEPDELQTALPATYI